MKSTIGIGAFLSTCLEVGVSSKVCFRLNLTGVPVESDTVLEFERTLGSMSRSGSIFASSTGMARFFQEMMVAIITNWQTTPQLFCTN